MKIRQIRLDTELIKKNTGNFFDIATNSFYASHIINGAGTSGIVCFNNKILIINQNYLEVRSSAIFNESEEIEKRFSCKVSGIDYDSKYIFSDAGYNFLPSEISAAFGLEQIKKLSNNIKIRNKNFDKIKNFFSKYSDYFKLPEQRQGVVTPWLAFPLVIKKIKSLIENSFKYFLKKIIFKQEQYLQETY